MELEFRPDVDAVRERWISFWQGNNDRPLFSTMRRKADIDPIPKPRPYELAFGDIDALLEQAIGWASTHEFLGDLIPSYMITFAPDHFAALLGAEIKRGEGTGTNWVDPCLTTLADVEIRFRREGRWWKRTVECIEKFRDRCDGKLIVTGTHFQGSLDCLAAMYGTQPLLTDMALAPDLVRAALDQVDVAVEEARVAMAEVLDVAKWGSLNRFGMYSPGVIDIPQCDVSCMISTEMFDDLQLPSLTREIACTENSIYHLDGPDALQHLESLCSIEHLDMIQWMPGEGYYDDDWSDLNSRIDSLGKGQIFQGYYKLDAARIERIWETFTSRKLYFDIGPKLLAQLPWC